MAENKSNNSNNSTSAAPVRSVGSSSDNSGNKSLNLSLPINNQNANSNRVYGQIRSVIDDTAPINNLFVDNRLYRGYIDLVNNIHDYYNSNKYQDKYKKSNSTLLEKLFLNNSLDSREKKELLSNFRSNFLQEVLNQKNSNSSNNTTPVNNDTKNNTVTTDTKKHKNQKSEKDIIYEKLLEKALNTDKTSSLIDTATPVSVQTIEKEQKAGEEQTERKKVAENTSNSPQNNKPEQVEKKEIDKITEKIVDKAEEIADHAEKSAEKITKDLATTVKSVEYDMKVKLEQGKNSFGSLVEQLDGAIRSRISSGDGKSSLKAEEICKDVKSKLVNSSEGMKTKVNEFREEVKVSNEKALNDNKKIQDLKFNEPVRDIHCGVRRGENNSRPDVEHMSGDSRLSIPSSGRKENWGTTINQKGLENTPIQSNWTKPGILYGLTRLEEKWADVIPSHAADNLASQKLFEKARESLRTNEWMMQSIILSQNTTRKSDQNNGVPRIQEENVFNENIGRYSDGKRVVSSVNDEKAHIQFKNSNVNRENMGEMKPQYGKLNESGRPDTGKNENNGKSEKNQIASSQDSRGKSELRNTSEDLRSQNINVSKAGEKSIKNFLGEVAEKNRLVREKGENSRVLPETFAAAYDNLRARNIIKQVETAPGKEKAGLAGEQGQFRNHSAVKQEVPVKPEGSVTTRTESVNEKSASVFAIEQNQAKIQNRTKQDADHNTIKEVLPGSEKREAKSLIPSKIVGKEELVKNPDSMKKAIENGQLLTSIKSSMEETRFDQSRKKDSPGFQNPQNNPVKSHISSSFLPQNHHDMDNTIIQREGVKEIPQTDILGKMKVFQDKGGSSVIRRFVSVENSRNDTEINEQIDRSARPKIKNDSGVPEKVVEARKADGAELSRFKSFKYESVIGSGSNKQDFNKPLETSELLAENDLSAVNRIDKTSQVGDIGLTRKQIALPERSESIYVKHQLNQTKFETAARSESTEEIRASYKSAKGHITPVEDTVSDKMGQKQSTGGSNIQRASTATFEEKSGILSSFIRTKPELKAKILEKSPVEQRKAQKEIERPLLARSGNQHTEVIKAIDSLSKVFTSAFISASELYGEVSLRQVEFAARSDARKIDRNEEFHDVEKAQGKNRDRENQNQSQNEVSEKTISRSNAQRLTRSLTIQDSPGQKQDEISFIHKLKNEATVRKNQEETGKEVRGQKTIRQEQLVQAVKNASSSIECVIKKSQSEIWSGHEVATKLIYSMVKASSTFTFEHSKRVINLSTDLAKALGITNKQELEEIEKGAMFHDIGELNLNLEENFVLSSKISPYIEEIDLKNCSFLHDIGKVKIPESILYKPGKLTDEEFEILKQHPVIGEEMLKPIPGMRPVLPAVRHHHERWDGKGYPDGLKGEEIPASARIISITDAYDAMISDRPYRKGMPKEVAISELKKNAGIQFDPHMVETFLSMLEKRAL